MAIEKAEMDFALEIDKEKHFQTDSYIRSWSK